MKINWNAYSRLAGLAAAMAFFLSAVGGTVPAYAKSVYGAPLYYAGFNDLPTNTSNLTDPDAFGDLAVSGGVCRIVETGAGLDKALYFPTANEAAEIKQPVTGLEDQYVISVDLKYDGEAPSLLFGIFGDAGTFYPVQIQKNIIQSHDGKQLGGLKQNSFVNLAVAFNRLRGTYSVYLDRRAVLLNHRQEPALTPAGVAVSKLAASKSGLYMDNILAYNSAEVWGELPFAGYNSEELEYIGLDDDAGDYTYFDSDGTYSAGTKATAFYQGVSIMPKTNEIECAKLDQYNKNRETYIRFNKTTDSDCFLNITMEKLPRMLSKKRYQYFLVSGMVKIEDLKDSVVNLCMLRDSTTAGTNQDVTLAVISDSGDLKLPDGSMIYSAAKNETYFEFTAAVDLGAHTADFYIDGVKRAERVPVNQAVSAVDLGRIGFASGAGTGSFYIDHFRIIGLISPYVDGADTRTSIYPDDTPVAEYLSDKTAFHVYAGTVSSGGEKRAIDGAYLYDEATQELYAEEAVLRSAFGLGEETVFQGGQVTRKCKDHDFTEKLRHTDSAPLYPVTEFARSILDFYSVNDGKGLLLFSSRRLSYQLEDETLYILRPYTTNRYLKTNLELINDYLFFERPDQERLASLYRQTESGHPRLMASKSDFVRVAEQVKTDPVMAQMHDYYMGRADYFVKEDTPAVDYVYDDKYRQLNTARSLGERMECLGYAYQVTGQKKYAERAWREFEAVNTFPDFNPNHVIDAGEYSFAAAIGYDWMYDGFTPEQRQTIERIIYRNSIAVLNDLYCGRFRYGSDGTQQWSFAKTVTNYIPVVGGGAIAAALAVADVYPEESLQLVQNALRSIEYTFPGFEPAGGWSESPAYWNYTIDYLKTVIENCKRAFGTDFGFTKHYALQRTGEFLLSLSAPQGINNFHDSNQKEFTDTNFPWVANTFGNPGLQAIRALALQKGWVSLAASDADVFELLEYNPSITADALAALQQMYITKGVETVGIREAYDDPEGLYLGTHFGAVTANHSHNDTGAFVFDILGERWAWDLGLQSYTLQVDAYTTYRRRAEGHNTLVINPDEQYNQEKDGYAPIIRSEQKEKGAYVIADMSSIWDDVSSAQMGYYAGDDMRSVTMRSEVDLTTPESTVYWFMHTKARIVLDQERKEAILSQNGKSIVLKFDTNAQTAELLDMAAEPLPTSPNPEGQDSNEEYRKVAIKMTASGKLNLTVKLAPLGETASTTPIMSAPLDEWSIPDGPRSETENQREQLTLERLIVGGTEYAPSTSKVSVPARDGEEPAVPAVQATAKEGAVTEIKQAESFEDTAVIRVFNPEKTIYNVYIIGFEENRSTIPTIDGAAPLPILGLKVSAEPQPANAHGNMLDADFSTRWTVFNKGDYADFDLGSVQTVDAAAAAFWKGDTRVYSFDLYASEDGEVYQQIFSGRSGGKGEALEVFPFLPVRARYIRLVGQGNSENNNTNILEFRVLNRAGEGK